MASVSSLDKDMRKLRLDRYTDQSANEVRMFIEDALGEQLQPGDLIAALKDGVALCKLVNLAVPNAARFKTKAVMPFVQMENIAIFIETCKKPPFNLQSHDIFLTVDLYESKDPAQVLQCIGAFSRAANRVNPSAFPKTIGGKTVRPGVVSPQSTGAGGSYRGGGRGPTAANNGSSTFNPLNRGPPLTPNKTGDSNSGRWSPTKSSTPLSGGGTTSSWSNRTDEGATSPAWNIAQYGYMGGASQGNLGVSFGGRRQIINSGPAVPSLADKQKQRREQEAEEERQRVQAEEDERRLQQEEEEKARIAEESRWADETKRLREQEKTRVEEERRKWEEEERQWRQEEEQRQREEQEAEARLQDDRKRARGNSDARLRGQFLSQYQAENSVSKAKVENSENSRIKELERQLEQARERERQYEQERQSRPRPAEADNQWLPPPKEDKIRPRSRSRPRLTQQSSSRNTQEQASQQDERDFLQQQWQSQQTSEDTPQPLTSPRPLPEPRLQKQNTGPRQLPDPTLPPRTIPKQHTGSRPLPDPAAYAKSQKAPVPTPSPKPAPAVEQPSPPQHQTQPSTQPAQNRTDRFLNSNAAPSPSLPRQNYSSELSSTSEHDAEDRRRAQSQQKTKAGGWASKSLLEREMENERERQREWEESQKETATRKVEGGGARGVDGVGGGIGGKWDVNQWTGYTGGDGQNKGNQGIGAGRRQIVGPRPPPPGR